MKRESCLPPTFLKRLRKLKEGHERIVFLEAGPGSEGSWVFNFLNIDACARISLTVEVDKDNVDGILASVAEMFRGVAFTEVPLTDKLPIATLGPFHPVLRGNISLQLAMEGETIGQAAVRRGYLQRDIEKKMVGLSPDIAISLTEIINFDLPYAFPILFAMGIEQLLNVPIPDRAKAQRMLLLELGRITNHLLTLGRMHLSLVRPDIFRFCVEWRQQIFSLFKGLGGNGVHPSLIAVGGQRFDFPTGFILDVFKFIELFTNRFDALDRQIRRSALSVQHLKTGYIARDKILEWGVFGPVARGSGFNWDLRKTIPYYFYDQVEFDVPLGVAGLTFDRHLVLAEEIRQSLRIILQIMDHLPGGVIRADDEKIGRFDDKVILPPGEAYVAIEGAGGELGVYIASNGTPSLEIIRFRSPSRSICQMLPDVLPGMKMDYLFSFLESLNLAGGEVDF